MIKNGMRAVHPGEVFLEELLKPSTPIGSTAIIKGQRGITGDGAVRLAAVFNATAECWMNLQKSDELRLAEQALSNKVRQHIEQIGEALVSA